MLHLHAACHHSRLLCSFDSMLDLKGNTAVYLLYAHARIAGIVRKVRPASILAQGMQGSQTALMGVGSAKASA